MNARIGRATLVLLAALGVMLAGCGGNTSPPAASSPAPPAASGADGDLTSQITSLYARFFDGTAAPQTKVALLQRGSEFLDVIKQQAAGPFAGSSGVKVTKVARSTVNSAAVTFDVLLDGKPVLQNQAGGAVLDNGVWKISSGTYCTLLSLQGLSAPPCQK